MVAPPSPELHAEQDGGGGDDGWLQSWEQELKAENELIAQAQALSLEASGAEAGKAGGGGKKKKPKKITLMSTTARRAA